MIYFLLKSGHDRNGFQHIVLRTWQLRGLCSGLYGRLHVIAGNIELGGHTIGIHHKVPQ